MFSLMADLKLVQPGVSVEINLRADDLEALLAEWLNELIYYVEADGLLFSKFEVAKIGERQIVAKVQGEKIDESKHQLLKEIKACTYHQLEVRPNNSGWMARVFFDI